MSRAVASACVAAVCAAVLLRAQTPPASPSSSVRRVCVLYGLETFSEPHAKARVTRSTATTPARLQAGTFVSVTAEAVSGFRRITLLNGESRWVREKTPQNRSTLCEPPLLPMRVCGDAAGEASMHADWMKTSGAPLAVVPRGAVVQARGYFEDQGRWTFAEHEGRVGFIRSDRLCRAASAPADQSATDHFKMTSAPAAAGCYQQHRERAPAEIRRIVIHNSEHTLKSAIATFQQCKPERPTSAHVAIDRDGRMYRLVEDRFAAFHTGANNGGFNAASVGIEMIASGAEGMRGITPVQEQSLVALIEFWARKYQIAIPPHVFDLSSSVPGYGDIEYRDAPVTIHRLVSASRGTDCPTFIWPDSPAGDDAFFRWRRTALAQLRSAKGQ